MKIKVEKPTRENPMALPQKIHNQYMQKHYEEWFRDRIPALDNKTPLEAIKTERGNGRLLNC